MHPVTKVQTPYPEVAVIVRATPGDAAVIARRLARDNLEASIATTSVPTGSAMRALSRSGDQSIPEINHVGFLGWLRTPSSLRREARALHLPHRFYYLAQNATVGQLLLGRTAGGVPVRGSIVLDSHTPVSTRSLHKGAIVVVTVTSSPQSLQVLDRLASALQSAGLVGLPVYELAR